MCRSVEYSRTRTSKNISAISNNVCKNQHESVSISNQQYWPQAAYSIASARISRAHFVLGQSKAEQCLLIRKAIFTDQLNRTYCKASKAAENGRPALIHQHMYTSTCTSAHGRKLDAHRCFWQLLGTMPLLSL